MKILHYIPILILLLLSACMSDGNPLPEEQQGNVTFLFTAGSEITTRTVLNSSDNRQHVEKVHLFIFKGTGDGAIYESVRKIPWPAPLEVDYKTTARSYSITLEPGDYTFLAIGLDDKSGATYNLPSAIAVGTTLANAKATLASGKTKDDIAVSELFAGWNVATVQATGNTAVSINLYRRVAGVLGYFKNVPADVQTIQVLLYEDQNTEVPLRKPTHNNVAEGTDFGTQTTGATDNRILLSIDKAKNVYTYTDLTASTEATGIFKGAYVLPKQAPAAAEITNTLTVQTLKDDGTVVKSYNVIIQSSSDGTSGGDVTGTEAKKFPLYANQLYSIGTKMEPVDLDEGGNEIVITVNPIWDEIIDIPF